MGLLDEAIRQHLELKRAHGASDEELQLQEQEALGPVRREPAESAAPAPGDAEASAEPDLEHSYDEPSSEPLRGGGDPLEAEAPAEPLAEALPATPPPEEFHEPIEDPYAEAGLAAPTEALPPDEDLEPLTGGETPSRGFEAVEEPAPVEEPLEEPLEKPLEEPEPGDEDDVLEETPEFLQETPEHDRLWFEQKPPRDFDFDE